MDKGDGDNLATLMKVGSRWVDSGGRGEACPDRIAWQSDLIYWSLEKMHCMYLRSMYVTDAAKCNQRKIVNAHVRDEVIIEDPFYVRFSDLVLLSLRSICFETL